MTRIPYADEKAIAPHEDMFALVEQAMGFVPNSLRVMARRPRILQGFLALSSAILGPETRITPHLKQLIAYSVSLAAGCQYCQAHTAHGAERNGVAVEKLEQAWNYECSPLFTDGERAAMAFAQAAGSVPNLVSDQDFETLAKWYDEDEITEILAVVSLFGFLNRWNDSLGTDLEDSPLAFAEAHLARGSGWQAGKHGGTV